MDDVTFWNRIAERYARMPVKNPDAFERKIAVTLAGLEPDAVVLDIGCGTGSLALRLAPHVAHVHGLDVAEAMIAIAERKARAQRVENVSFHVGAFDDGFRGFADGSLDGICAYSLLHLVDDRRDVLARIHRLLRPGGLFVASTVCLGGWFPYGPLLSLMRRFGRAPRVALLSKRVLREEIENAGFVEVQEPDVGSHGKISFVVARKPR